MQTLGEHETGALNQNTSESPFKKFKPVKVYFFPISCLAYKVRALNSFF